MTNFSISLSGGIGKHICATSMIKWISEKFPDSKITVISMFPELFEHNPRIWRNLPFGQAYLFEDYIKGTDYRIGDPYTLIEYYRPESKMHINELFPKAYGFGECNSNAHNEIFLTKGEKAEFMELESRKIITLQISGGIPPGIQMSLKDKLDSSYRDIPMPMAIKIASIMRGKGYEVIQVRGQNEPSVPGTTQLNMPLRNLISMGMRCKGHIGMDSSFMHAMAAFDRPQLIFWGNTSPDNLGYSYPKVINARKECATTAPNVSMPDRAAIYPRVEDCNEKCWDYSDTEIQARIDEFIRLIE